MQEQENTIQRLQSTLHLFTVGDTPCIQKIATATGERDVLEQIDLLRYLPPSLANHYPHLVQFNLEHRPFSYTMVHYPWPTLRHLVLYSEQDADRLFLFLQEVVHFLFEKQHRWQCQRAPSGYAARTYVHRIWERLLVVAKEHALLHALIHCHSLWVGEEKLPGASLLLHRLDSLITPWFGPVICSTHGQMGFTHVLIDTHDCTGQSFILLDAKGRQNLFDPAYDIGKLWECSAGFFDWIEERHFTLGEVTASQHQVHIDSLQFAFPDRQRICLALHERFQHQLEAIGTLELTAYRVAAAAHLLGSVDFFYHILGLDCAIASYIQGVRQLAAIPALVSSLAA